MQKTQTTLCTWLSPTLPAGGDTALEQLFRTRLLYWTCNLSAVVGKKNKYTRNIFKSPAKQFHTFLTVAARARAKHLPAVRRDQRAPGEGLLQLSWAHAVAHVFLITFKITHIMKKK